MPKVPHRGVGPYGPEAKMEVPFHGVYFNYTEFQN